MYLWVSDCGRPPFFEFGNDVIVLSKVKFRAYKYERDVLAMVAHFRIPLGSNILEGGRVHQRKAYQEDILKIQVGQLMSSSSR